MEVSSRAYVLHQRPYQNTSAIIEFFTLNSGKASAVAKGLSRSKKFGASVKAFSPLELNCRGKGELLSLLSCEAVDVPYELHGKAMFCGLYLNELLLNFLPKHEPEKNIFSFYEETLGLLSNANDNIEYEMILRVFEVKLLLSLGYGLNLNVDKNGEDISQEAVYYFVFEEGFEIFSGNVSNRFTVSGHTILSMARHNYHDASVRKEAKQLMRRVIDHFLGGKTLKSRELFL